MFELNYNNINGNDDKVIKLNDVKYNKLFDITNENIKNESFYSSYYNLFFNNNKLSFKIKNINSSDISFDEFNNICVKNLIHKFNNKYDKFTFEFDVNNVKLKLSFSQDKELILHNVEYNNKELNNIIINLEYLTSNIKFNEIKELFKNPNYFFDFDIDILLEFTVVENDLYVKDLLSFKLLLRNINGYVINNKQNEIKNKIIDLINENNNLKNENNELKNENDKLLKELKKLKDEINNLKKFNNDAFMNDINELLMK